MNQESLFHDDIYDALDTIVKVLGGKAAVGVMLKPELKDRPGTAEGWIKDCLNRNNKSDFKPQQLIFLFKEARQKNCHAGMWFFSDACDYQRADPLEPETEMARLERQMLETSKAHMDMMNRFQQMMELKNQQLKNQ